MNLDYCHFSDVGRTRKNNEDACAVAPELGLFLVADGMGGHAAGDVASRIAAKTLSAQIADFFLAQGDSAPAPDEIRKALRLAFRKGNDEILGATERDAGKTGMGTTLTAALFIDGRYHIGHVGDSRAYLIRDDAITQITRDHSYVEEMVRRGLLKHEAARTHPNRNIITRSLGTREELEMDYFLGEVRADDRFLLCSDGLNSELDDESILRTVLEGREDLAAVCRTLVARANEAGGRDNTTVVMVHNRG